MSEYRGPIEFRNSYGVSRFQPALSTGERLYVSRDAYGDMHVWLPPTASAGAPPVLCSWRKAARIAAREARRRERNRRSIFKEVTR